MISPAHKDPTKTKQKQPTNQTYKPTNNNQNEMNSFIESTKQPISLTNPNTKIDKQRLKKKKSQVQSKTVEKTYSH